VQRAGFVTSVLGQIAIGVIARLLGWALIAALCCIEGEPSQEEDLAWY
jgi:hypothetical protein